MIRALLNPYALSLFALLPGGDRRLVVREGRPVPLARLEAPVGEGQGEGTRATGSPGEGLDERHGLDRGPGRGRESGVASGAPPETAEPVRGEPVPGETVPGETMPGETMPGEPVPATASPGSSAAQRPSVRSAGPSDPASSTEPALHFEAGELRLDASGRVLVASPQPRELVRSPAGDPTTAAGRPFEAGTPILAREGLELVWSAPDLGWGYLRVERIEGDEIWVESAHAPLTEPELRRDATGASAHPSRSGEVRLDWSPARSAAPDHKPGPGDEAPRASGSADAETPPAYVIERRPLAPAGAPFEGIATDARPPFLDRGAAAGVAYEYRIREVPARPGRFATLVRSLPIERSLDACMTLERGQRIDLLSGQVVAEGGHVEISYASDASVNLRPLDGSLLTVLTPGEGWEVPAIGAASEGRKGAGYSDAPRSMRAGIDLVARLPEGLYVRFGLAPDADGASLWRVFDPFGGRVLPLPPAAARIDLDGADLRIEIATPAGAGPASRSAQLLVEAELGFGRLDWEELARAEPGASSLRLARSRLGPDPLRRLRLRWRLGDRLWSRASEPIEVLLEDPAEPARAEQLTARAVGELSADAFDRREAARAVLRHLGDAARPTLVRLLESSEAEVRTSARELLLEGELTGAEFEEVMRAGARSAGLGEAAPEGWMAPDRLRRARALFATRRRGTSDPAEEARQRRWLQLIATQDPDDSVRRVAGLLARRIEGARPEPIAGVPRALLPPSERRLERDEAYPRDGWADVARSDWTTRSLARTLLTGADLDQPELARIEWLVAFELARAESPAAPPPARALDALRLCAHYQADPRPVLLDAAEALVPSPGARLDAWHELAAARLAGGLPERSAAAREVRELAHADAGDLMSVLEELDGTGATDVDVRLPAGVYELGQDVPGGDWLDVRLDGLRLVAAGDGEVVLRFGVRANEVRDLVLERVRIENESAAALIAIDSNVVLKDSLLAGSDYALMLHRSRVEAQSFEIGAPLRGRPGASCVRMQGPCSLIARDSIFRGGALMPDEDCRIYLEACVVDGAERAVIQGLRGGDVIVRDALLVSRGMGVHGTRSTLLEGVVFEVQRSPLGSTPLDSELCPDHVHLGDAGQGEDFSWLDRCPLVGRR